MDVSSARVLKLEFGITYTPEVFEVDDPATLHAFMRKHSFAPPKTHTNRSSQATHLPMLLEADRGPHGTLIFHMTRAITQWRNFGNGNDV